jgi:hypothetical protein
MRQRNRLLSVATVASLMIATPTELVRMPGTGAARGASTNLDRTWTRGGQNKSGNLQVLAALDLANRRSLNAERTGFEPVMECYPHTGLANRRFRPLSHLSTSAAPRAQAGRSQRYQDTPRHRRGQDQRSGRSIQNRQHRFAGLIVRNSARSEVLNKAL